MLQKTPPLAAGYFGDMIPKLEVDRLDARGTVLLVILRNALFDFLE